MKRTLIFVFVFAFCWLLIAPDNVQATSQWARKEGVSCATCHQGFPRLNETGQMYMENGYTFSAPGETSEDAELWADVKNLLGFRLNIEPFRYETSSKQTTFGNTPWAQFFIAGQIAKDFSIFIENEIDTKSAHFSWYKFGYHQSPRLNLITGNLSPLDHSSMSNRLRILPSIKNDFLDDKVSKGKGEASVNPSSARPGFMYYGRFGSLVPYIGVSSGVQAKDLKSPNTLNLWAGARYDLESGSNFSLTYYEGADVLNGGTNKEVLNKFKFVIPAFNLRSGGFDLQTAVKFGEESNYTLGSGKKALNGTSLGYGLNAAYMYKNWQPAVAFDRVEAGEIAKSKEYLTAGLSYFPRENIRFTLYQKFDLVDSKNQFFFVIRTMF